MGFWRDNSGRLTFDLPGVAAVDYPAVCRGIADALGLAPAGEIVIAPEQMYWDFGAGSRWSAWTGTFGWSSWPWPSPRRPSRSYGTSPRGWVQAGGRR